MRIPVLRGCAFQDSDKVVVISQAFADLFRHGSNAVGHHLEIDHASGEIVGIVGHVQQHSGLMGGRGPYSLDLTIYLPAAQTSDGFLRTVHLWFAPKGVVRTSGPIAGIAQQIQATVAGVDPQLPMATFQTIDDLRRDITHSERFNATVFSILAALAMILAAVGLYGLVSQSVSERAHELGGLFLALPGVAAGAPLSLAAVRFVKHMIWGIPPADPITFISTTGILLLATASPSTVPALRILHLDPAQTLRRDLPAAKTHLDAWRTPHRASQRQPQSILRRRLLHVVHYNNLDIHFPAFKPQPVLLLEGGKKGVR